MAKGFQKGQNNMTSAGKKYAREVSKKVGLINPRYKAGELDESLEFEFPTKAIAQKFMREISQESWDHRTRTSDGKVTTTTNSVEPGEPTMSHMKMARIRSDLVANSSERPRDQRWQRSSKRLNLMKCPQDNTTTRWWHKERSVEEVGW